MAAPARTASGLLHDVLTDVTEQIVRADAAARRRSTLPLARRSTSIQEVTWVVLARHAEHQRVWRQARKLDLHSTDAVRAAALRGLEGEDDIWQEGGVARYLKMKPDGLLPLKERVKSMGVQLATYGTLQAALTDYAQEEKAVQ